MTFPRQAVESAHSLPYLHSSTTGGGRPPYYFGITSLKSASPSAGPWYSGVMSRIPIGPSDAPHLNSSDSGSAVNDALFRAAFRNSPAMHSIVRFADAVLVEVNEKFTRTLGYSRDEVIGKTPFELNFWIAPERLQGYREQLETKGFVRDFEVELRAKDGSIRTVLLSSEVVDIDGEQYSLSAGVDISERKRSEKIQQATYQISEAAHAAQDLG